MEVARMESVLCLCLCVALLGLSSLIVSGGQKGTDTNTRVDFPSNVSSTLGNVHFVFPGLLVAITRLEAAVMYVIGNRPNPPECTLEVDVIECGGYHLLELWRTRYQGGRSPGEVHGNGTHVKDIYDHNVHRVCARYHQYDMCIQNKATLIKCASSAHTTINTLYAYICQPSVTLDLVASGECMYGVTTEQIFSHIFEPCWADYAGFSLKILSAVDGSDLYLLTWLYSDMDIYYNCYIPGVQYFCGDAAGRLYKGLVVQLEEVMTKVVSLVILGYAPSSYKGLINVTARYYHTTDGMDAGLQIIKKLEKFYRNQSRVVGSCSASALVTRESYCFEKSMVYTDLSLPNMEYACGPYGLLAQFTDCYYPATSHCKLTINHNITDVINKVCEAFKSARTSDYCQPPLSVANKYLRACDMDLHQFMDYVTLLSYKIVYSVLNRYAGIVIPTDYQHACLSSVHEIEGSLDSPGCGSGALSNILAGMKALAEIPRSMAKLWDTQYKEQCSLKLIKC